VRDLADFAIPLFIHWLSPAFAQKGVTRTPFTVAKIARSLDEEVKEKLRDTAMPNNLPLNQDISISPHP
jgi:hypothetical protein